jgi:hypothetical protein
VPARTAEPRLPSIRKRCGFPALKLREHWSVRSQRLSADRAQHSPQIPSARNRPLTLRRSIAHHRSMRRGCPQGRHGQGYRMGTVVRLPKRPRAQRAHVVATRSESATVIILPVIRIERYESRAEPIRAQRRRRRRRAARP